MIFLFLYCKLFTFLIFFFFWKFFLELVFFYSSVTVFIAAFYLFTIKFKVKHSIYTIVVHKKKLLLLFIVRFVGVNECWDICFRCVNRSNEEIVSIIYWKYQVTNAQLIFAHVSITTLLQNTKIWEKSRTNHNHMST